MARKGKLLGYHPYELFKGEYQDDDEYIVNEIDIFPIVIKEQIKLQKLFELLEITISKKLIGHTKIWIATKEVDIDNLKDITKDTKYKEEIKNECSI